LEGSGLVEFTPTKDQITVIDALPIEKVLVLAGAGTGKTETLVRKVERMIDQSDIASGNVLVLTFSRAAVRELKKRMAQRETDARFVRARTFDSFATRLLCARPSTDDISNLVYE
jgi:superfamily I DNA/RNA helicase